MVSMTCEKQLPSLQDSSTNSRLLELLQRPENRICCDCSRKKPSWASLLTNVSIGEGSKPHTIGAFCCILCSAVHRSLGTHICFVRSVHLDQWREEDIAALDRSGNRLINEILEATLFTKIKPKQDMERRKQFIYEKYVEQRYASPERKLQFQPPKRLSQQNLRESQTDKSVNSVGGNSMPYASALPTPLDSPMPDPGVASVTPPRRSWSLASSTAKPEVRRLSMPSSPLEGWMRDVNEMLFSDSTASQKRNKEQAEMLAQTLKQKGATCSDDGKLDLKRHLQEYRSNQVGEHSMDSQSPNATKESLIAPKKSQEEEDFDGTLNGKLRVLRNGAIRPSTPSSRIYHSQALQDDTLTDEFVKYRSTRGGGHTSIQDNDCPSTPPVGSDGSSTWRSWLPSGTSSTGNSTSVS